MEIYIKLYYRNKFEIIYVPSHLTCTYTYMYAIYIYYAYLICVPCTYFICFCIVKLSSLNVFIFYSSFVIQSGLAVYNLMCFRNF